MSHIFLRLTFFIVIGFCLVLGAADSAPAQSGCKQQCVREAVKCVQYGTQCTQYQNRCARYDTKGRCLQQQQVCVQKKQICTQQQKVCAQYQTVCPPQRQGNSGGAFQQLQKIERGQGGFDGQ